MSNADFWQDAIDDIVDDPEMTELPILGPKLSRKQSKFLQQSLSKQKSIASGSSENEIVKFKYEYIPESPSDGSEIQQ